jgi:ABC-type polysaccharide/polyol phosphate export permease
VLPLSIVLGNTLQFVLALPVLAIFLVVDGYDPEAVWLVGVPLLFAVQLLLTCGIALFISTATVFFRDLEHITEVLLTLLFYATPIIYSVDRLPDQYDWVVQINPLAPVMEGWRDVLLEGHLPGASFAIAVALTVVAVALGWWTFRRLEDAFADVV